MNFYQSSSKVLMEFMHSRNCKRNEIKKSEKRIRETLGMPDDEKIIFFSSLKKIGIDALLSELEKEL